MLGWFGLWREAVVLAPPVLINCRPLTTRTRAERARRCLSVLLSGLVCPPVRCGPDAHAAKPFGVALSPYVPLTKFSTSRKGIGCARSS
jgi:hypothetical protein